MKSIFSIVIFGFYLFGTLISAQGIFTRVEDRKESVTGVRATVLPDKRSIYLLWTPNPEEGDVIVARSHSVIDTPEKLYVADSLGRFPSEGKKAVTNFYDYNLKPGSYFYAVVPVEDIRKRRVKLRSSQNYTTSPIIIDESFGGLDPQVVPQGKAADGNKTIGTVIVKGEGTSIRVNWVPPWNSVPEKTIYSIYRSQFPMSTMDEMRKADKLAELPHPVTTYLDQDLSQSQTLYYGVSVKEENHPESIPLENGKSFVRIFFIYDNKGKSEAVRDTQPTEIQNPDPKLIGQNIPEDRNRFQVNGFGYERVGKGAMLRWNAPANADDTTQYTIYAATRAFDQGVNSFIGGSVLKVGVLSHPRTSLAINEIKPVDPLYFAITAKKANISEDFNVIEGVSYFRYDFNRDVKPEEIQNPSQVQQQASRDFVEETKNDSAKSDNDLSNSRVLGKKPTDAESEVSKPTELDRKSHLLDRSNEEWFATNESQIVVGLTDEQTLRRILKSSYAKKQYEVAFHQLEKYVATETNPYLRGRARLFAGISRYHTGQYKKALDHFLHSETNAYQSERAIFWKNKALAKIGRGEK